MNQTKITITIGGAVNVGRFSNFNVDVTLKREVGEGESFAHAFAALRRDALIELGRTYAIILKEFDKDAAAELARHPLVQQALKAVKEADEKGEDNKVN